MRTFGFLIFLAACTHQPEGSPAYDHLYSTVCDTSVAEYCSMYACNRTLEAAEHDTTWCGRGFPAEVTHCDGFDIVSKSSIDTTNAAYYRDGELVAITMTQAGSSPMYCFAGPESLKAPYCHGGDPLPACAP
jgi:hypothetical protein